MQIPGFVRLALSHKWYKISLHLQLFTQFCGFVILLQEIFQLHGDDRKSSSANGFHDSFVVAAFCTVAMQLILKSSVVDFIVCFSTFGNGSTPLNTTTMAPTTTPTTEKKPDTDLPQEGESEKEHYYSMNIFFVLIVIGKHTIEI